MFIITIGLALTILLMSLALYVTEARQKEKEKLILSGEAEWRVDARGRTYFHVKTFDDLTSPPKRRFFRQKSN
jgi:hypothetical protein